MTLLVRLPASLKYVQYNAVVRKCMNLNNNPHFLGSSDAEFPAEAQWLIRSSLNVLLGLNVFVAFIASN